MRFIYLDFYFFVVFFFSSFGIFSTILLGGFLSDISTVLIPALFSLHLVSMKIIKIHKSQLLLIFSFFATLLVSLFHGVQFELVHRSVIWVGASLILVSAYNMRGLDRVYLDRSMDIFRWPSCVALGVSILLLERDASTPLVVAVFLSYTLGKEVYKRSDYFFIILALSLLLINGARITLVAIFFVLLHLIMIRLRSFFTRLLIIAACSVLGFVFFNLSVNSVSDNGISILGLNLNTSGRAFIWILLIENIFSNWAVGIGVDMPMDVATETFKQPHNDYLRIAIRSGLIVFLAFALALGILFRKLYRFSSYSNHWSCFYVYFTFLMFMFTDNPLIYFYVLYPVFFLVGSFVRQERFLSGRIIIT